MQFVRHDCSRQRVLWQSVSRCLRYGIQKRGNGFVVVPCPEDLNIRVDSQSLLYMSREEIRDCAMRVRYGTHHIAVEFFHSLTDGYGGLQFLKGLLAEYFGVPMQPLSIKEAWEDSYQKVRRQRNADFYAGGSFVSAARCTTGEQPGS